MYQKTIEEIRSELSKKQFARFIELLKKTREQDKLDVLARLAKKRFLKIKEW